MWQQNNQHIYPLPTSLPRRTGPVQLHCCGWWPANPWLHLLEHLYSEKDLCFGTFSSQRSRSMWTVHCSVIFWGSREQLFLLQFHCYCQNRVEQFCGTVFESFWNPSCRKWHTQNYRSVQCMSIMQARCHGWLLAIYILCSHQAAVQSIEYSHMYISYFHT